MPTQLDRLCARCEDCLRQYDAAKTDAERAVLMRIAIDHFRAAARLARYGT